MMVAAGAVIALPDPDIATRGMVAIGITADSTATGMSRTMAMAIPTSPTMAAITVALASTALALDSSSASTKA